MKTNKARRLLTLALVLITTVAIASAMMITASAEESFEFTVIDEAYTVGTDTTCGRIYIEWTYVDADTFSISIDGVHVTSVYDNYYILDLDTFEEKIGALQINESYLFEIVPVKDGVQIGSLKASASITPRHNYDVYYTNDEGHWCACGISAIAEHTGGTATCVALKVCEVCNIAYGELDPDNHETDATYYEYKDNYEHFIRHECCKAEKLSESHASSYVYSLTGESTITATCKDCTVASYSVTLNAPTSSLVYDGEVKEATADGVIYGVDAAEIVYESAGATLAGAPTDAGSYTAKLTYGDITAEVSFIITKAPVAVPSPSSSVYTGATQNSGIENTDTYTVTDIGGTDVGEYTATVKLNDDANYVWADGGDTERSFSYEILPFVVTVPDADNSSFVYTGSAQIYDIPASDYYTVSGSEQTDAKLHTVTVALKDKHNYVWNDGTVEDITYSFNIEKADTSIIPEKNSVVLTYGEALTVPSAVSSSFGTVEYTVVNKYDEEMTDLSLLDAGVYEIRYVIEGTDNYNGSELTVCVTVNVAQADVKVSEEDITITYLDTLVPHTVEWHNFGTVNVYLEDSSYNVISESTYSKLHAGEYVLNYKIKGTDNYLPVHKTVKVTVLQKKVAEPTVNGTYTYNGYEQTVVLDGLDESIMTATGTLSAKDASTYDLYVELDPNYAWDNGEDGKLNWTISKKNLTVTAEPATVEQYYPLPPEFSFVVSGLEGEDTAEDAFTTPVLLGVNIANTQTAGKEDINLIQGTPNNNYTLNYIGAILTISTHENHKADDPVTENYVAPDCVNTGSYDTVVYCKMCKTHVMSRKTGTVDALGHSYEAVVTDPTCTEKGYTTNTCSVCNDTYKDTYVDANGHSYEAVVTDPTCTEQGYTTHTCSVCNDTYKDTYIDANGHDYDEVVTAPTCTEQGYTTYTCSVCDYTYNGDCVDELGHDVVVDEAVAATCTETGLTEGSHCNRCNETLVAQEITNALGHTEGVAVIENDIKPDCTNGGSYDTVVCCTVCNEELSRVTTDLDALGHTEGDAATCTTAQICTVCNAELVAALGHTEAIDAAVAPTCTEDGLTEGKHCSVCNEVLVVQEAVDKLNHIEVVDATVAANCTETGLTEGSHCDRCGEILVAQETIPALGHTEGDAATCTTAQICTVCNAELVAALGHTEAIDAAVAPTCTEDGLTEGKHCSVCNEVLVAQEAVDALGHTTEPGKVPTCSEAVLCTVCDAVVVPTLEHRYDMIDTATCTKDGYILYVCPNCHDESRGADTVRRGHRYDSDNAKIFVRPTCTEDGYFVYYCDDCDYSYNSYDEDGDGENDYKASHDYADATCISLATCRVCNQTEPNGQFAACELVWTSNGNGTHNGICPFNTEHNVYNEKCEGEGKATCTNVKKCDKCQAVLEEVKDHTFSPATCTAPATCTVCGTKNGEALGHSYEGSCTEERTCSVCGNWEGNVPGHVYGKGLINSNKCQNCGEINKDLVIKKVVAVAIAIVVIVIAIKAFGAIPTTTPWWRRMFR